MKLKKKIRTFFETMMQKMDGNMIWKMSVTKTKCHKGKVKLFGSLFPKDAVALVFYFYAAM